MTTPPPTAQTSLICPRCAYDLSAVTSTWTNACPLHDTCPECGRPFLWAHIFNPELTHLPWLIEHARWKRLGVVRAFAATARRTLNPITLWRDLDLIHPVRVRRLILHLLLCFVVLHVLLVAARFIVVTPDVIRTSRAFAQARAIDQSLTEPPRADAWGMWTYIVPDNIDEMEWVFSEPDEDGSFTATPASHTAWLPHESMGGPSAPGPVWAPSSRFRWAYMCDWPDTVPSGWTKHADGAQHGTWRPVYDGPTGQTLTPTLRDIYLTELTIDHQSIRAIFACPYFANDGDTWFTAGRVFSPGILPPLVIALAMPFVFVLIASSLTGADIDRRHIARGVAYSAGGLLALHIVTASLLTIALTIVFSFRSAPVDQFMGHRWLPDSLLGMWIATHLFGSAAWLFAAWWMYCKRYLNIAHAFLVTLLLSILAYIAVPMGIVVLVRVLVPRVL